MRIIDADQEQEDNCITVKYDEKSDSIVLRILFEDDSISLYMTPLQANELKEIINSKLNLTRYFKGLFE